MTKKLSFDAGHGKHTAGKRAPSGVFEEREWFFNDKILRHCLSYLRDYDVQTLRVDDPTGETDVLLAKRVQKINAFNPTAHLSFHNNAFQSKWGSHGGTEVFHSKGSSKASVDLAKRLQPALVKALGTKDRGVKKENWYIITHTKAPAVLLEFLFMDSNDDIKKLRSNSYLKKAGETVAKELVKHYGLKKKSSGTTSNTKPNTKPTTSKPSTSSTSQKPLIMSGSTGEYAKQAQNKLIAKGYSVGKSGADGIIGKDSVKAIKQFQTDAGLVSDGKIGVKTWKVLDGSFKKPTKPTTTTSKPSTIKVGSKVTVKKTATKFATGDSMASFVKGSTYKVAQVKSDRVRLEGINSWVYLKDIVGGGSTSSTAKTTAKSKLASNKYVVNGKAKIKSSARYYVNTGNKKVPIPSQHKNKTLTIQQVKSDKVLMKELYSWVSKSDLV